MAADYSGWCLIESDPGVFSELVEMLGVRGVAFAEVYGLDKEAFDALEAEGSHRKVLGFIFLFNWGKDKKRQRSSSSSSSSQGGAAANPQVPQDLFFAAQTVENACASQAILSILLNQKNEIKEIGKDLEALHEFIADFSDPTMKGEAIGSCEAIRAAHNSFRPNLSFEIPEKKNKTEKEAFHFVSYVPHKNAVYELDGLKEGPLCVGEINGENWIEVARREIQRRVEEIQSQGEELRFNLMALTTNPLDEIEEELKRLQEAAAAAAEQLQAGTAADSKELQQTHQDALSKIEILLDLKAKEESKRAEWQRENARRRHDFTPFILCALRHLARKGELVKAVRRATAAAAAAEAAAAAKTV